MGFDGCHVFMDMVPIPISALQHYLYCPRQCALIHIEQHWQENVFTAEGRVLHELVDKPGNTNRTGVRTVRALQVFNLDLGIAGVADVVEFHPYLHGERVYPVEYKRGKPKDHRADEVQLCAQALCLEKMYKQEISEGALFYGRTRRRHMVTMDKELRLLTLDVIEGVRNLLAERRTPPAIYDRKRCDPCSLIDICLPRLLGRKQSVHVWLRKQLKE